MKKHWNFAQDMKFLLNRFEEHSFFNQAHVVLNIVVPSMVATPA